MRRFEDALAVLALSRTALGDGAGVHGLHRWHRDIADASDGKRRGWWLEAAADVYASVSFDSMDAHDEEFYNRTDI